ncbi:Gis3p NDAI_0B02050 [Naumovozyma dairenensis CBS 421]|uniref:Uncharacterized protein n=1 Tax=Naumovozyma dairenensis (strain ATCC 10597 / BCRC 20456 / CBS 421 / NBRC 0211 / NRRL Y-12639) TaxID=1071378 RepID=G0W629_NAUDC|nr:hypothetical protein NDAI_0B02050 [Naumovozyma dairenensis CBS 421]CCD23240.1 hypothetical protein NDAI_0B02050 [Naumovozyma dairenensis CBS 421]
MGLLFAPSNRFDTINNDETNEAWISSLFTPSSCGSYTVLKRPCSTKKYQENISITSHTEKSRAPKKQPSLVYSGRRRRTGKSAFQNITKPINDSRTFERDQTISLNITPSMNSVLSQIKRHTSLYYLNDKSNAEDEYRKGTQDARKREDADDGVDNVPLPCNSLKRYKDNISTLYLPSDEIDTHSDVSSITSSVLLREILQTDSNNWEVLRSESINQDDDYNSSSNDHKGTSDQTQNLSLGYDGNSHPLCEPEILKEKENLHSTPRVKLLNMPDLDFHDEWKIEDIIQTYKPVYEMGKEPTGKETDKYISTAIRIIKKDLRLNDRPALNKKEKNIDLKMPYARQNNSLSSKFLRSTLKDNVIRDETQVELESWPTSIPLLKKEEEELREEVSLLADKTHFLPNKRSRQQKMNPNFLKLYSIETSCRLKNILPEINIDDQVLKQLSYHDIKTLPIKNQPKKTVNNHKEMGNESKYEDVSCHDIKMAIITKKKLWADMLHETREDLFGVSSPWNLKFVAACNEQEDTKNTSTLVRVHSELKPWVNGNTTSTLLKPCGKLKIDRRFPSREIQYVVKGWCDSRFVI